MTGTYQGGIAVSSVDDDSEDTADDPSAISLLVVAGHHFRNDDEGHITGQVHFEYMKVTNLETSSKAPYSTDITDIYIPGLEVAVDHAVGDRFRVYAAADASYAMNKIDDTDLDPANDGDTMETKSSNFTFDWIAGIGFAIWNNVQLDAVFYTNNLTSCSAWATIPR